MTGEDVTVVNEEESARITAGAYEKPIVKHVF